MNMCLQEAESTLEVILSREQITQRDVDAIEVVLAEIKRLQAIVAKLPKTADGVPVVPGIDVWVTHQERHEPYKCTVFAVGNTALKVEVSETHKRTWVWQSACYSTREAAEEEGK